MSYRKHDRPIPFVSRTDQPQRVALTNVRFEITSAGRAALGDRSVPRRKHDVCTCGHYGKTHDSSRRCRGDFNRCPCRALTIATTEDATNA